MSRFAVVVLAVLSLTGCGDDGPSCEERGGHTVQDPPIYIKSGNVMVPIEQSHCEMPK